jgi:hypothetical protein
MPHASTLPACGQDNFDHENSTIDKLRAHIRDSLISILDNLPELKGLHTKMLDTYEREDDYDHLNKWLQGLLRFMKIHCLTGVDKEQDSILVTDTSLKGKAECWFSLEVEHLNCIVCDWTFKSPDPYSFKQRLINGMLEEYQHHLKLYDSISVEHSSIDDIVQKA